MSVNFTLMNMPRDPENTKPSVFAASVLYFIALSGLYLLPVVLGAIELFFGSFLLPEISRAIEVMYYLLFIIIPVLIYARRHPAVCADVMRINPLSFKVALLCSAAALIAVYLSQILTVLWSILIEFTIGTPPDSNFQIPTTAIGLMMSVVTVAILPGLSEEILFRGAILGAWEIRGSKRAILISSIWFMLMHGTITGMPVQFLSGLALGFIAVSTDSIFGGMVFHTVYNAATLILAYVLNQQTAAPAESILSIFESIGGIAGIVQLIFPFAIFTTLLVLILKAIDADRIKRNGAQFGYPASVKRDFGLAEYLVMGASFSIVFLYYLEDLLLIMGWI